jgi:tRNA (uracil-5-)-methyltransferase TRM9
MMNNATARHLNAINRAFYTATAEDFHATRGTAWRGWERLLPDLSGELSVLDVGCGNGRFGVFLAEHGILPLTYHALDNNPALLAFAQTALDAQTQVRTEFHEYDLVEQLLQHQPAPLADTQHDLVVLFGVMHHIPGAARRLHLMRMLAECVRPGGLLAFACWRFYEQERFRSRITPWDAMLASEVEAGDYLLDWKRGTTALRYCHHVDDAEHAMLVAASGLREIETYRADGETGDANRYSLLRA